MLAQAVKRLYPDVKLAIGPAIENGFYYDFDAPEPFTPADLEAIEKEIVKIEKENFKLERFELPRTEAIAYMEKLGEPYKVELRRTPSSAFTGRANLLTSAQARMRNPPAR